MAQDLPPPPPQRDEDDMAAYLAALDLKNLNLSHLEGLDEPESDRLWLIGGVVGLVLSLAASAWLSTTSFFVLNPVGRPLFWALLVIAAMLAAAVFPTLSRLIQNTQRAPAAPRVALPSWLVLPRLSSRTQLLLMISLVVMLVSLVVLILPREVVWTGSGYGGSWYLAVGAAITAGILLGRVLMAAAERAPSSTPKPPIRLPSWMRWVTLAALVATGIGIVITSHVMGDDATPETFPLAGVGLVVGILGAIWLVRRFDEMEVHYRKRAEQEAILRGD